MPAAGQPAPQGAAAWSRASGQSNPHARPWSLLMRLPELFPNNLALDDASVLSSLQSKRLLLALLLAARGSGRLEPAKGRAGALDLHPPAWHRADRLGWPRLSFPSCELRVALKFGKKRDGSWDVGVVVGKLCPQPGAGGSGGGTQPLSPTMPDAFWCHPLVAELPRPLRPPVSLGDPLTSRGPFPRWGCHTELPLRFSAPCSMARASSKQSPSPPR